MLANTAHLTQGCTAAKEIIKERNKNDGRDPGGNLIL